MSVLEAMLRLEEAIDREGWDCQPAVMEVIGGDLVMRSKGGHPADQIGALLGDGWRPQAIVVVFEGLMVVGREEAEQMPEWRELSDVARALWEVVGMMAVPSEMGPFRTEVRSVIYADVFGEQHVLTRQQGGEPYWADGMDGEVAAAVLEAVTPKE